MIHCPFCKKAIPLEDADNEFMLSCGCSYVQLVKPFSVDRRGDTCGDLLWMVRGHEHVVEHPDADAAVEKWRRQIVNLVYKPLLQAERLRFVESRRMRWDDVARRATLDPEEKPPGKGCEDDYAVEPDQARMLREQSGEISAELTRKLHPGQRYKMPRNVTVIEILDVVKGSEGISVRLKYIESHAHQGKVVNLRGFDEPLYEWKKIGDVFPGQRFFVEGHEYTVLDVSVGRDGPPSVRYRKSHPTLTINTSALLPHFLVRIAWKGRIPD